MIQNVWNQMRFLWSMHFGDKLQKAKQISSILGQSMKQNRENSASLSSDEVQLVQSIRHQTALLNRDNLSRTNAYLDFFTHNPEIHWALLAHCVSRNGGYGMTDAYGEWFMHLASPEDARWFHSFLERANWLIFHDAYPQLLLYQAGKEQKLNLSHLVLPLGVSRFMLPMWNYFWNTKDSGLLTRALIINEQNFVESRVIQNHAYRAKVIASANFQIQSWLNLNQVLFPYTIGNKIRFAGTTMRHFTSVENRIRTGLKLYQCLYQDLQVHQSIHRFMCQHPHTGSRSDYWPDIFTLEKTSEVHKPYRPRFVHKNPEHRKIYSPYLTDACPLVEHEEAEPGDWFADMGHLIYLLENGKKQPKDITGTYIRSIQTIEGLLQTKERAESFLKDFRQL